MIITFITDGMGNQMFQYALGKQLSVKHRTRLKLVTNLPTGLYLKMISRPVKFLKEQIKGHPQIRYREYALNIFNINTQTCTHPIIPIGERSYKKYYATLRGYTLVKETHFNYDKNVLEHTLDNALVMGYWQSPYYFQDIEAIIRKEFTFKYPVLPISQPILQKMQHTPSVCMHIRRGDYIYTKLHNVISDSTDYFYKAATLMANKLETTPHFFIFSNDVQWCKIHMKLPYPVIIVDEKHAGKLDGNHLQLMKNCKHFVISNSSFSWWAAWLCDYKKKIVIAPKKWFNSNSDKLPHDVPDLLPKNWIRI